MQRIEIPKRNKRFIGRVMWYGGFNRKTGQENKFGFLDCVDKREIFVHESGLACSASQIKEGVWVTFTQKKSNKGISAIDVILAENETDTSAISRLLDISEIAIEVRMRICFHMPLEPNHPLVPSLKRTIEEFDNYWTNKLNEGSFDFPSSWNNLNRKSPLYSILPKQIKQAWFDKKFPGILKAVNVLSDIVEIIERDTEIYYSMSSQDKDLALTWAKTDNDYEKAKMLSARGAELISAEFFTQLGKSVKDIAIHQVTRESDDWKSHDLVIDSRYSVDVKNARRTINSNSFVEYTFKQFKKDLRGKNVLILGVLSPYLSLAELENKPKWNRKQVKILGVTSHNIVKNLEKQFSKRQLSVDFGDFQRWPIWLFNNHLGWFSNQQEAIEEFRGCVKKVKPEDWNECKFSLIPVFLIAGLKIPKHYLDKLLPWQIWYLNKIVACSASGNLTLPWLYLFTFSHFIEAITNIGSAESKSYTPEGYNEVLFSINSDDVLSVSEYSRPSSLIDPLQVIQKLIETLNILWNNRYSTQLNSLKRFIFRGKGLLSATNSQGKLVTVLAYCGGYIEGKGKCGNSPLIIGLHEICNSCNMLKCNKCGYCSEQCKTEI
ncbi:MAG: cold shock domain-containing protein [Marinicella sp.]